MIPINYLPDCLWSRYAKKLFEVNDKSTNITPRDVFPFVQVELEQV